jgi:hypothetical protein
MSAIATYIYVLSGRLFSIIFATRMLLHNSSVGISEHALSLATISFAMDASDSSRGISISIKLISVQAETLRQHIEAARISVYFITTAVVPVS